MQLHLNNAATLTDEEIETHTISAWKDAKFQRNPEAVGASEPLFQRSSLIQVNIVGCIFYVSHFSSVQLHPELFIFACIGFISRLVQMIP